MHRVHRVHWVHRVHRVQQIGRKIRFVFDRKARKMDHHDEWISMQISVHRIGGPDSWPGDTTGVPWPRTYGPWTHNLFAAGERFHSLDIPAVDAQWDHMTLRIHSLAPIEHDRWYGGELSLSNTYDSPIGSPRPFHFYGAPADLPVYTHFFSQHFGHYTVGFRHPGARPLGPDPDTKCDDPTCFAHGAGIHHPAPEPPAGDEPAAHPDEFTPIGFRIGGAGLIHKPCGETLRIGPEDTDTDVMAHHRWECRVTGVVARAAAESADSR